MIFPQAMTEVQLIVPARDLLAVTKLLAGQGIFHQVDGSYLAGAPAAAEAELSPPESWRDQAAAYAALERRVQAIMQTLQVDEGPPPAAGDLLMIESQAVQTIIVQMEEKVKGESEHLSDERKRLEQLQGFYRQLEPLAGLDIDISALRQPRFIFSMLGTIPVDNIERLRTSLTRVPFVLATLRHDGQTAVVWLGGPSANSDILERAARSAYLNPLNLPEMYQGSPSEIMQALQRGMQRVQEHIAGQNTAIARLRSEHRLQLQELLWRLRFSRILTDAIVRYGRLRYTYLIVGWVPGERLEYLRQQLQQVSRESILESFPIQRSGVKLNVPVALHNPRFLRPFELLVTTYARPLYAEIDPTLLLAVTFPLLFGAMFGDVGQGLVLVLLGLLLSSRRVAALRSLAGLGGLVTACGLSATLFGFLYGSLFGVENLLPALWMRPMENIMPILIVAVAAGVVLLSLGFLVGLLNAWMARDWGRLIFDHNGLAGLVLYWSLVGLVLGVVLPALSGLRSVFIALALVAGLAVMFSEALEHLLEGRRPLVQEGAGAYAIQAVFELFETLISLLSNSLSYVRVGAFAVAHVGLSAVVFMLAALAGAGHGVGYWLVVVLGNLFIVGFEGLIVGIQTMRLEYYEFFSKFFTGGGKRYEPLTLQPQKE